MKRIAFFPLAVVLFATAAAVVSCEKTMPTAPSSGSGLHNEPNGLYVGGNNWNTLWYFGTPDGNGGCVRPCGFCHASPWQFGYQPNGNDPENNEALCEISVINGEVLLVSVDLSDIGDSYVNEITSSQRLDVATFTPFPQDIVDAACDEVSVPHWGGPVGMTAANYPVIIESTAADARLEIEGTYDSGSGWSWVCYVR
jgi:hypothetical protein